MFDDKIESFHRYCDSYFLKNPNSSYEERMRALKKRASVLLEDVPLPKDYRTKVHNNYYRGKLLNKLPEYESQSEIYLNRAVKLEPESVDSWNELGECLWKKGDKAMAVTCFQTALEKQKNSCSLRCLSIALRQQPNQNSSEKRAVSNQSLALLKEALELDNKDGSTWYYLGNANLQHFFATGQTDLSLLNDALSAYEKSISVPCNKQDLNSDLCFNYAQALCYEQKYEQGLRFLDKSARLDPYFKNARVQLSRLCDFLYRSGFAAQSMGNIKSNQLQKILQTFPNHHIGCQNHCSNNCDNLFLLVAVVGLIRNDDSIPYCCAVVDSGCRCFILSVYNISNIFGLLIGDLVCIRDPVFINVDLEIIEEISFRAIRVVTPTQITVNGKKLAADQMALSEATTE